MPLSLDPQPLSALLNPPAIHVQVPDRVPMFQPALRQSLAQLVTGPTEHMIGYDEYGNQSMKRDGGTENVRLDDKDQGSLSGLAVMHNHPAGSSLSGRDLEFARKNGLKSMSAADDHNIYTISNLGKYDGTEAAEYDKEMQGRIGELEKSHTPWNWHDLSDTVMQALSKRLGFDYTKEDR